MDELQNTTTADPLLAHTQNERWLSIPQAIVVGATIIAAAVIIGSFIVAHGPFDFSTNTTADSVPKPVAPNIKKVATKGLPFVGSADAPVVVAYWSDYQCPFCKKFETTTFRELLKNEVLAGKVAVVFKDFSFLGPDSTTAALYERAVWELYPEKFLAWREAMFDAQDDENAGFGDEESILKLTAKIPGFDAVKVQKQVATKRDVYQKALDADRTEALSFGIQGTPSLITGTKLIPGFVEYKDLETVVKSQLK